MSLYLGSAFVDDARRSAKLGFVAGITTNPTLVSETGRKPLDLIAELCDVHPGTIFYQPGSDTTEEREAEARQVIAVRPGRIAVKASEHNLGLLAGHAADRGRRGCRNDSGLQPGSGQPRCRCQSQLLTAIRQSKHSSARRWSGSRSIHAVRDQYFAKHYRDLCSEH